jgi:hypothetical protein
MVVLFRDKVTKEFYELLREAKDNGAPIIASKVILKMLRDRVKQNYGNDLDIYTRPFKVFLDVNDGFGAAARFVHVLMTYQYKHTSTRRPQLTDNEYLIANYKPRNWLSEYYPYLLSEQRKPENKWIYNPDCSTPPEALINITLDRLSAEDTFYIPCRDVASSVGMTYSMLDELLASSRFQEALLDKGIWFRDLSEKYFKAIGGTELDYEKRQLKFKPKRRAKHEKEAQV